MIRFPVVCKHCGFQFTHQSREASAGKDIRVTCPRKGCWKKTKAQVPASAADAVSPEVKVDGSRQGPFAVPPIGRFPKS